jgi:hexosaminidase
MFIRLTLLMTFCISFCCAQEIIPLPNHYEAAEGRLSIPKKITVSASDKEFAGLIQGFARSARKFYAISVKEKNRNGLIRMVRNAGEKNREGYRLIIGPDRITIEAGYTNGCFYGLQSVMQLINSAGTPGSLSCTVIRDYPRYQWRGVMLDESRHFIGTEEVKRLFDFMALHKLNKFHWHLTDAQGWRIEVRQYPLLTSIGGTGTLSNPGAPARFYTRAEIAGLVEYAGERFIEVIPEIDMPGHASSAVKAYPEFDGGGSETNQHFTFNPGKDGTYEFLTNIIKDISDLFPSRYIHIGGDEVNYGNQQWNNLPEVQQLMQTHHLTNLVDVEHYFLNRMADSIRVMGKTIIGWDEIVTAGLPASNTIVMWWRHEKPQQLEEALRKGYEVILSPRIPLYFDFVQYDSHAYGRKWSNGAFAPIESVYLFPDSDLTGGVSILSPLVMGIQANIWTERIHTPERLQFMVFPRLSALAESAWTEAQTKNPGSFNNRMGPMMSLYKKMEVAFFDYRNPATTPEIPGPVKQK